MTHQVTLSRERVAEMFKAVNGIGELLKAFPAVPENQALLYAIMSNLAVIRTNLAQVPRASSN